MITLIRKVPHLIPYQGSKRKLAPAILENILFKSVDTFYEPFAGSAAVTLAAATNNIAEKYVISDKFEPLMSLWDLIINNPNYLYSEYRNIWVNQLEDPKNYFLAIRDEFNEEQDPVKLLYLIARCVKNSIRFNSNGDFNQSSDNRRLGMKPDKVKTEALAISFMLKGKITFKANDFMDVISTATPNDIVYMDPPWQGTSLRKDSRYAYTLNLESLISGMEFLNKKNVPFLLSFDGTCGDKEYGGELPKHLGLTKINLDAGRSTQATLLGRNQKTVESLYLSKGLLEKNEARTSKEEVVIPQQAYLF